MHSQNSSLLIFPLSPSSNLFSFSLRSQSSTFMCIIPLRFRITPYFVEVFILSARWQIRARFFCTAYLNSQDIFLCVSDVIVGNQT